MLHRMLRMTALTLILLVLLVIPALAQDLTLVPFTDEVFGVQGVIPEGWTNAAPGLYTRNQDAADTTALIIQSLPSLDESLQQAIWSQLGLDEKPESIGEYQTDDFTWTLYQIEIGAMNVTVDVAMATRDARMVVLVLQSPTDDATFLREAVFVPVLDALRIRQNQEVLPYRIEEVNFANAEITLAGTLTLPEGDGPHSAVVLMTGSGPQNRDAEAVLGFPIFRLIADALTRQGIAVLRYDDRGVGQSTGDYSAATIQDFAADGRAAVAYLASRDDIDAYRIGAFGHSEGALYAAMLGADADSGVAFIVSMSGTAVAGTEGILHQNRLALEASGLSEAYIHTYLEMLAQILDAIIAQDEEQVISITEAAADNLWGLLTEDQRLFTGAATAEDYRDMLVEQARSQFLTPWYRSLITYNPADDWGQTTIPMLAIFGALDVQVDVTQNAVPLTQALLDADNPNFSIVVLSGANHLFQPAQTGSVDEYYTLPYEFVPELLPTLTEWVLLLTEGI